MVEIISPLYYPGTIVPPQDFPFPEEEEFDPQDDGTPFPYRRLPIEHTLYVNW